MSSVKNLTDAEIRLKLSELGYPVGPITATTRKVLIKKLKLLTEQNHSSSLNNKVVKDRSSLSRYSSEEESEDDLPYKSRINRKSMPPPPPPKSPQKSVKRKSLPRLPQENSTTSNEDSRTSDFNVPSASSTLNHSDTGNIFSGFPDKKYSPKFNKRVSYSQLEPKFSTFSSQFSSKKSLGLEVDSYDHESDTDGIGALRNRLRGSPSSLFSSSSQSGNLFSTQPRFYSQASTKSDGMWSKNGGSNSESRSSSPFTSEFVRKLSAAAGSNKSGLGSGLPSRLLDVKESDDEDIISTPQYSHQSIGNLKRGKAPIYEGNVWKNASSISVVLLFLIGIFFCILAVAYLSMHYKEAPISSTDAKIPLCHEGGQPGVSCILSAEKQEAMRMFREVYQILYDKAVQYDCTNDRSNSVLTEAQIKESLVTGLHDNIFKVDKSLSNVMVLIRANPQWGVVITDLGLYIANPSLPLTCYLMSYFYGIIGTTLRLILGFGGLFGIVKGIWWWMDRKERNKKEVYEMVEKIIDILSTYQQTNAADNFLPISHVRDQLIPPHQRDKIADVWNQAVAYLEGNESRVRTEVQQVQGEEFRVWRWLSAPRSNGKRKVWQGQAFETMEGSVNSLPVSPTPCLKIRHMFDSEVEAEEDWVTRVRDAILEKCEGVDILHVTVDKGSNEGCVYMKCASSQDAGRAYRALHGSWFDSKLVTVKYLRLERYHERFPEAVQAIRPLAPSNNRKLSLQ